MNLTFYPNPFLNTDGMEGNSMAGERIDKVLGFTVAECNQALHLNTKYKFLQQSVVLALKRRLRVLEATD